jgi:hypothetical protein
MNERNRHYDKSLIGRFWHESKFIVHVIILVASVSASAGIAWQVFAGDVEKIKEQSEEHGKNLEKLNNIVIEQAVLNGRIDENLKAIKENIQEIKRNTR